MVPLSDTDASPSHSVRRSDRSARTRSPVVRLTLVLMPPLTRGDLAELHCIQPIKNVASILRDGILSNYAAKAVQHESVADPRIQQLREPVVVPVPGAARG